MAKGLANADFALKGVSFSITKGEKVAFCGRTGSGKSSLFNLLVKLYEFQKGDIIFFGNPLSDYGTVQLRS
jgi:ABC-type multidrug transport system fused ATPase/permease subunit